MSFRTKRLKLCHSARIDLVASDCCSDVLGVAECYRMQQNIDPMLKLHNFIGSTEVAGSIPDGVIGIFH